MIGRTVSIEQLPDGGFGLDGRRMFGVVERVDGVHVSVGVTAGDADVLRLVALTAARAAGAVYLDSPPAATS